MTKDDHRREHSQVTTSP